MPISTVTGTYTAVSGSETAVAGATIASATWNSINTDYQNTFTTIGTQVFAQGNVTRFVVRTISVSTAGDIAISIPVSTLPGGAASYAFNAIYAANATATTSGAGVSMWTGAGGTGVNFVASISINITTSLPNAANSMTTFVVASTSVTRFNANPIYFRVVSTAAASVDLFVEVRPL